MSGALLCFMLLSSPAHAHVKTNNWDFVTNTSSWSVTDDDGTNVCDNNGSSTGDTTFGSLGHNSNLSGQSAWHGQGGALILTTASDRAMAHQTLTIPGSGSVKAFGRFRYYANSNGWSGTATSWIRMDLFDSSNATWVANLGCASFNSNQAWAQTSPVDVTLTGGTTYTLRLTMRIQSTGGLSIIATTNVGMDDVELNVAPTGVSVSQPSTSPELSWSTSTPGSGAPALHASQAYEVARHTASPVTTAHIIGSTTNTSYTDSATTGNTTYYYTVFDKDTNNTRSPAGNEVSVLTKPTVPTSLVTETQSETSIGISWQAPTGGAVSYRLQRAPDVSGSPGTYTDLAPSHNGTSYTNSGLSCSQTYWYRVAATNASGQSAYTMGVVGETDYCISITLDSDGVIDFGVVSTNQLRSTRHDDLDDQQTIIATHGPVDLSIKTSAFTHSSNAWSLGGSAGANTVKWAYSTDGSSWHTFTQTNTYSSLANSAFGTTTLFMQLTSPASSSSLGPYSATITVLATRPE